MGYFHALKVSKLAFLSFSTRNMCFVKNCYSFSTFIDGKALASEGGSAAMSWGGGHFNILLVHACKNKNLEKDFFYISRMCSVCLEINGM